MEHKKSDSYTTEYPNFNKTIVIAKALKVSRLFIETSFRYMDAILNTHRHQQIILRSGDTRSVGCKEPLYGYDEQNFHV